MVDPEPLDGELALASHWVVKSKAEILKIGRRDSKAVTVVACVIGFGVLGAGIGFPVAFIGFEMGVLDGLSREAKISSLIYSVVTVLVFGILGTALGGYVGNRITEVPIRFSDGNRSKDK